MSDAARFLVAAFLLVPIARAEAGVPPDTAYAARLARASAVYDSLAVLADAGDSAYRARLDTLRIGGLVLLSPPARSADLRVAGADAWRTLHGAFGSAAERLTAVPYVAPSYASWSAAEFSSQIVNWGSGTLYGADSALRAWLGGVRLDSAAVSRAAPRAAVDLLTASSSAARRCYEGALDGCRLALGLLPGADLVAAAYSAADRRVLVAQLRSRIWEPRIAGAYRDCQAGDDSSCASLLHALPPEQVPAPLGREARMAFARVALDAGGPTAFARLTDSAALPLGEQFALAAGIPLDSLLSRWRAVTLAARPARVTTPRPLALAAVGWSILFAAAATRSSRWR